MTLENFDKNKRANADALPVPLLVTIKFRGNVAAVEAAMEAGIAKANEVGSDLIIAIDPDADRVGVMAKGKDGKFHCLTGNQMGVLLTEYNIGAWKRAGKMPENGVILKSLVTTEMARAIAEAKQGAPLADVCGAVEDFVKPFGFVFI